VSMLSILALHWDITVSRYMAIEGSILAKGGHHNVDHELSQECHRPYLGFGVIIFCLDFGEGGHRGRCELKVFPLRCLERMHFEEYGILNLNRLGFGPLTF
jgi:hypothetical protein